MVKILLLQFNFLIVVVSEQQLKHLQNSQYVQASIPEQNKSKGVLKTKQDIGVLNWNVLSPSDYSPSNLNMHQTKTPNISLPSKITVPFLNRFLPEKQSQKSFVFMMHTLSSHTLFEIALTIPLTCLLQTCPLSLQVSGFQLSPVTFRRSTGSNNQELQNWLLWKVANQDRSCDTPTSASSPN